jgi:hypothetical protein
MREGEALRPRSLIAPVVLVVIAGGCRGPDYYASKAPTEIAEMVQVRLADLGPGEAGYLAPTITGTRSYRLYGSKNLDNGRTTHVLSVDESAMGEHQSLAWARSEAAREVCALSSARLLAGPEGSPGEAATFELADQSISCEPARYCEPVQEVYIEKYKDEHGHTQRRKLYTTVQRCNDFWRCHSERIYRVAVRDRTLRDARYLPEGMSVELGWSCGGSDLDQERLELPASYLDGYLLAVDGYTYAPAPSEAQP